MNIFKFSIPIVFLGLTFPKNFCSAIAKTKTLSQAYDISYLNDVLNPFFHCLIHLINYKQLDLRHPEIPIVLEGHGYGYKKTEVNRVARLKGNLRRRQKDSFRWKCVFHGFLFPKLPSTKIFMSKFECKHYYKEYWTGNIRESEAGFSNLFRHRDFWIYFTDRKSFKKWMPWARGMQQVQGATAQSFTGIVYISKSTQPPEWYISCRTCHPRKFTFHQQDPSDQSTLIQSFYKFASAIHPDKKFQVSDIFSQLPANYMKTAKLQSFDQISTNSTIDILTFSSIYPNSSYIFEITTYTNDVEIHEPEKIVIGINTATHAPNVRLSRSSYRFLTCDGLLQRELGGQRFVNLVSAYTLESWLALLILGLISAILLKLVNNMRRATDFVDSLLLPVAFLLEQGVNMPPSRHKLISSISILAPWLLMSVVLSNGYKGSNVTDLISPLKGVLISNFKELIDRNYTIFVPTLKAYEPRRQIFIGRDISRLGNSFYLFNMQLKNYGIGCGSKKIIAVVQNLLSKLFIVMGKHNMTVLDGILPCNKSAMVVYGSEIDEYEAKLKFLRPKSNIVKNKDELFEEQLGRHLKEVERTHINS
ncbi:hypothetical protein Fcan01_16712 [Folsomia candida]|uniref:Uncharacterized protein n=1 Tax=Folsomia candida TaxID=158441 RepID=A0A226DTX9_FOLCA|nr:hypothetical protein Fcan01_16712 [Folsomia candida]